MTDRLAACPRAEFWQILARAFMVPHGPGFLTALRDNLAEDLGELANKLEIDLNGSLKEFSRAVQQVAGEEELLVIYSSLFLTPPIPCRLMLGWHLDGTLMGPSERYLHDLMARHGVAQHVALGAAQDVLPTVLELVAWLLQGLDDSPDDVASDRAMIESDMVVLRTHYLGHAIGPMITLVKRAEQDGELTPVYSALLKIVNAAIADPLERFFDSVAAEEGKARPRYFAKRESAADLICCSVCGTSIATARELRVVVDRLRQAGLPFDHLTVCSDCREAARGWKSGSDKLHVPGFG